MTPEDAGKIDALTALFDLSIDEILNDPELTAEKNQSLLVAAARSKGFNTVLRSSGPPLLDHTQFNQRFSVMVIGVSLGMKMAELRRVMREVLSQPHAVHGLTKEQLDAIADAYTTMKSIYSVYEKKNPTITLLCMESASHLVAAFPQIAKLEKNLTEPKGEA